MKNLLELLFGSKKNQPNITEATTTVQSSNIDELK